MQCKKCSAEISEGVNFCPNCGEQIEKEGQELQENEKVLEAEAESQAGNAELKPEPEPEPKAADETPADTEEIPEGGNTSDAFGAILKKIEPIKQAVLLHKKQSAVIAGVCIIFLVVAIANTTSVHTKKVKYINYWKLSSNLTENDDEIGNLRFLSAADVNPITIMKKGSIDYNYPQYSEDGRYMYYSDEPKGKSATLYRVETEQLQNGEKAKESELKITGKLFTNMLYGTDIDGARFYDGYTLLDGSQVLLMTGRNDAYTGNLELFDGEKSSVLAKDVYGYRISFDQHSVLYLQKHGNDGFSLYRLALTEGAEPEFIDNNILSLEKSSDSYDTIYYIL